MSGEEEDDCECEPLGDGRTSSGSIFTCMSSSGEADIRTDGVNLLMFSIGGLSPDLNSNQITKKY